MVDFMLDLVGYTSDENLFELSLLEPSFGNGEFLIPAIERLLIARTRALTAGEVVGCIKPCIHGVELHEDTFQSTRRAVIALLEQFEFSSIDAIEITDAWLVHGDFLLAELDGGFNFVIGNPPYVRQELIPGPLLEEYRKRFATLYDRADLYVPFMERSLNLLGEMGQLCFICSDRWMKNKYGGPLRSLISQRFHLRAYVDMVDADAFHSEVSAYPAITVISTGEPGPVRVAERPSLDKTTLRELSTALRSQAPPQMIKELHGVVSGSEPWILSATSNTELIRRLEQAFPSLEETGCKVGIGVATGADNVFIGKFDDLDVEPDRKLPLAMGKDLGSGHMVWRGYGVINPFTDEGPLVDLDKYPRLKRYLEGNRAQITKRHVAQKSPKNWYRTIDRITPSLARRPKLLIPDIRGDAQVVFEEGWLYPHHNLYFVVSDEWNLRALQAVLLSNLTRLFVSTYSIKMRGGYLRFQAQYLRRIRLPKWETVSLEMRARLVAAAETLDFEACNSAVADLYSLTTSERNALIQKI
ncbi:Eco57I restriction-modification methylase domain-containing protein [Rugamonas sp. CCM 8940]|uniref:Eco57I restriction-modification methylase domain-containing protein n=1 Tax=Rugamonas sp. CCM 8940 TaxID=2765359 RepID=UPI00351C0D3C